MSSYLMRRPVATLTNRKNTIAIPDLPAKLGRNENSVDVYLFHESVSREHCIFECINGRFTLTDLNSTAGTFINGTRLESGVPYHIDDGAKVKIGKVKFVFNADYEELASREQSKAREVTEQDTGASAAASAAPRSKTITVRARELNIYEYDESEVVFIDCGLAPEEKPLSYTNQIKKSDIEDQLVPEEKPAEEELMPEEVQPAAEEAPVEEAPEEAAAEEEAPIEEVPEEDVPAEEEVPEAPIEEELFAAAEEPSDDIMDTRFVDLSGLEEDTADEPELSPFEELRRAYEDESRGKPAIRLTWIDDEDGETKRLTIDSFPFRIGRKSDENDYALRKKGVSRRHFHFEEDGGDIMICDDDSTNGVLLNGRRIAPGELIRLESGDRLRVGGITIAVRIDEK